MLIYLNFFVFLFISFSISLLFRFFFLFFCLTPFSFLPSLGIREWFRWYKTPDSKPLNVFGYEEKALNSKFACEIIEETHHYWKDLIYGETEKGGLWVPDHRDD
jgi:hypothetical protein